MEYIGLLGGVIMFAGGMWYLERQRVQAAARGEHFVPSPRDHISLENSEDEDHPRWQLAILPLALVLLTIILPRLITGLLDVATLASADWPFQLLRFAVSQPVVWPSIALVMGTLLAVAMFSVVRSKALLTMGQGVNDAIMPLINTAAVIGFGGVVTHTAGFESFTRLMLESPLPPLASMFASVSLVSAITGSASGGLQIFMQTMAPAYITPLPAGLLRRGVPPSFFS